ncbi:MAG: hypothetical protein Kow0042_16750 [Calditrichia bacterium]
MNSQTVNLIERPYQEIVDDVLTAIVGGVVNEPIIFDVKVDLYPLAEPALDIRGITGTVDKARYTFQKGIDFLFSEGDNAVVWQEGGVWPDDETIFYVDYFRQESRSPLSDINVGSVTRTISEAISREIATVYQQINLAYLSAFLDTAQGKSLDLVVSILGITRKTKDFAVGLATFFRDPSITGNITIPQNTQLSTSKEEAFFQTTEPRTLQRGQVRIDVPIRATDDFKGEAGRVDAGTITNMVQPIAGITRVNNFEATFLGAEDETDEQLRGRARAVLRSLGKATIAALHRVIAEVRGNLLELQDPNSPADKRTNPGSMILLVEAEPERFPGLRSAVEETRAAGVLANLIARYVFFKPRMVVEIASGLTPPGKDKVIEEIIAAIQSYVDGLSSGEAATGNAILNAVKEVEDVKEVKIADVLAWRTDLAQPAVDTVVDSLLTTLESVPAGDSATLRQEFKKVLTEELPPVSTGRRIADRDLVQGPSGQRATDAEIENGEFSVVAQVNGEDWWVVLDMEAADIVLAEKES